MLPAVFLLATITLPSTNTIPQAFAGHPGALVMIDCANNSQLQSNAAACSEKLAPCSTFKIWNSAIGLETGLVTDPDALFWKWDGQKRWLEDWNKDQTMRSAFAASCVPAYQALARKIGAERMQHWLDLLHYGDRNISSGVDVFWLPAPERKPLLITPLEQAELIAQLVQGKLPFSPPTLSALKSIMEVKKTDKGILYGKTGTAGEKFNYGWFVGYVESAGQTYAFACILKGDGIMGKDARAAVESILTAQGFL